MSWFGIGLGGDESQLLGLLDNRTASETDRIEAVQAMSRLPKLSERGRGRICNLIDDPVAGVRAAVCYAVKRASSGFAEPEIAPSGRRTCCVAELADVLEALGDGDNMIAALDVHYDEIASSALAAAVVFQNWEDEEPLREFTVRCDGIAPYVPGQFFQRELPCLLAVLSVIQEPINVVVIDGYVTLGDKPGLGIHLWEALQRQKAVVGVAKTRFHSASAVEVCRGLSKTPLFVTAVGMEVAEAAAKVVTMAGSHRIPMLLRGADQLARMIRSTFPHAWMQP